MPYSRRLKLYTNFNIRHGGQLGGQVRSRPTLAVPRLLQRFQLLNNGSIDHHEAP
jgi:hypothetical protein